MYKKIIEPRVSKTDGADIVTIRQFPFGLKQQETTYLNSLSQYFTRKEGI